MESARLAVAEDLPSIEKISDRRRAEIADLRGGLGLLRREAGPAPVSAETDVYAMGVLLFRALAGVEPFTASEGLACMLKHLTDPPPPLPDDVPRAFESVIHRALAKAATAREKFEFHVGEVKVTARKGECRILSRIDFTSVPRDKLDRAIRAFEAVLREEG